MSILIFFTGDTTIIKNYSSLCYDVIITNQKLKIDKYDNFSSDIDFNIKTDKFREIISLINNQFDPRRLQRTQCPSAAQRKQNKRVVYYYIHFIVISAFYRL